MEILFFEESEIVFLSSCTSGVCYQVNNECGDRCNLCSIVCFTVCVDCNNQWVTPWSFETSDN